MSREFDTVRSGYDRIGVAYRDWSRHSAVRLRWVQHLLGLLAEDSLVLDLGCGSGEPATRMLAEQHRVIGVDASAQQLGLAARAAPSALFVQADMTRLALRPQSVDAVASFYATGHVPSRSHRRLLGEVAEWLRPGGVLLTSFPLTRGDGVEPEWLGVPMFFGGVGEAATHAALTAAGLVIEHWEVVPEDEGDGRIVSFGWVVARKPPQG